MIFMVTQQRIKELLHYDGETGIFRWIKKPAKRILTGSIAGTVRKDGYVRIGIDGEKLLAHRLAWIYVYGDADQPVEIDHKNRQRSDNAIGNLRACNQSQNQMNTNLRRDNTTGHKGIVFTKGKWQAKGHLNGEAKYLGRFCTKEEAIEAYERFSIANHGEFKRTEYLNEPLSIDR